MLGGSFTPKCLLLGTDFTRKQTSGLFSDETWEELKDDELDRWSQPFQQLVNWFGMDRMVFLHVDTWFIAVSFDIESSQYRWGDVATCNEVEIPDELEFWCENVKVLSSWQDSVTSDDVSSITSDGENEEYSDSPSPEPPRKKRRKRR